VDGNVAGRITGGEQPEADGNILLHRESHDGEEINGNRLIHDNEIWQSLVGTPHHKGHLPPDDPFWQFGSPVELWGSTIAQNQKKQQKSDGKKDKKGRKGGSRRRGGKNRRRGGGGQGRNSASPS